jgi:hypothetical protein
MRMRREMTRMPMAIPPKISRLGSRVAKIRFCCDKMKLPVASTQDMLINLGDTKEEEEPCTLKIDAERILGRVGTVIFVVLVLHHSQRRIGELVRRRVA